MMNKLGSNNFTKRPVGGGFLSKIKRNHNLYLYHLKYPEMTHLTLAQVFKVSRVRVTQILKKEIGKANK